MGTLMKSVCMCGETKKLEVKSRRAKKNPCERSVDRCTRPAPRLPLFLFIVLLLGVLWSALLAQANSMRKLITIGLVTDTHYDLFPAGEKAPWESMAHWRDEQRRRTSNPHFRRHDIARDKMNEAIALFNSVPDMNVVVNLGDLVNNNMMWNLKPILDCFHRAKAPHYSILGNHDSRGSNDRFGTLNKTQRAWLMSKLGLRRSYYFIDHPPFRLVFIDSVALDLENENAKKEDSQIQWIKETMDKARDAELVTILFAHIPIGFETSRLGRLLKGYEQLSMVFSGHDHKGRYAVKGPHRVHCVSLAGQIEGLLNAFAVVEIFEDRAEITGFGRVPSRILPFGPPVVNLLRRYRGPLRHDLTPQGYQPPPPEELWANEVLQKPPKPLLNIPDYRKPLLRRSLAQNPPRTEFYNKVVVPLFRHAPPLTRSPEETVDLTSETNRSTFLINGVTVIVGGGAESPAFILANGISGGVVDRAASAGLRADTAPNDNSPSTYLHNAILNSLFVFIGVVLAILIFMGKRRRRRRPENMSMFRL